MCAPRRDLVCAPPPASGTQNFELRVIKFFAVNKSAPQLPFQIEDAARPDTAFEGKEGEEARVPPVVACACASVCVFVDIWLSCVLERACASVCVRVRVRVLSWLCGSV